MQRKKAVSAYARYMGTHKFWQYDPVFFADQALRDSDFFSEKEFIALPIAQQVFLPFNARHIMAIVMQHDGYVIALTGFRVLRRPPFSDQDRDRLQAYRPHVLRSYRHAQQRTLAKLTPTERLHLAFPALTPRQLAVASWIAQGKSNEDIAAILSVGIDTVKAHVKAIHAKIGAESRLTTAIIAHTVPPFSQLPPLWKLGTDAWAGGGRP